MIPFPTTLFGNFTPVNIDMFTEVMVRVQSSPNAIFNHVWSHTIASSYFRPLLRQALAPLYGGDIGLAESRVKVSGTSALQDPPWWIDRRPFGQNGLNYFSSDPAIRRTLVITIANTAVTNAAGNGYYASDGFVATYPTPNANWATDIAALRAAITSRSPTAYRGIAMGYVSAQGTYDKLLVAAVAGSGPYAGTSSIADLMGQLLVKTDVSYASTAGLPVAPDSQSKAYVNQIVSAINELGYSLPLLT